MSVVVGVRFPLGRYHATAWDRSVNEGAVEWPPAPWRLLRALVSTWYTRWPELPAPELDDLLAALDGLPSYRTPTVRAAHTRHYLPDPDHSSGETGRTDLTLDPYLSVRTDAELLVRWEAELTGEQRARLGKLAELVPYLGRADSVCEMRLIDLDEMPDQRWWRPAGAAAADGTSDRTARLLATTQPVSRPMLEMSTVEVRRQRRTVPPGTRWVTYTGPSEPDRPPAPPRRQRAEVTAVRFAVVSRVPLRATHGVLLADEVHGQVTRRLDGGRTDLLGHAGARTDHRHAHWVPVPDGTERGAAVASLVVWAPGSMTADEVAAVVRLRSASGRRGARGDDDGYERKGFPAVNLLLQSVGTMAQVAPELCRPARRWRSLTPYLPVRYRKRETLDEYVTIDAQRELAYRDLPPAATVGRLRPQEGLSDRWSQEFRRYRAAERLAASRRGLGLRLEFAEPVEGPILLGQLSHFGYGIFVPEPESAPGSGP